MSRRKVNNRSGEKRIDRYGNGMLEARTVIDLGGITIIDEDGNVKHYRTKVMVKNDPRAMERANKKGDI